MDDRREIALRALHDDEQFCLMCNELATIILLTLQLESGRDSAKIVHLANLHEAWNSMFFSNVNRQIYLLNRKGELTSHTEKDILWVIGNSFGDFFDESDASKIYKGGEDLKKTIKKLKANIIVLFIKHVKLYRQRSSLEYEVDIFVENAFMKLLSDGVKVIYTHHPFQVNDAPTGDIIDLVIEDYKQHFPEFTCLIMVIAAARFASDRRDAFIWLHAQSNWGKGFFLAALSELGLTVELSLKEIEKALEGAPVGRSIKDFLRQWVLVVDEFKTVKSEIKMLNSSISASPKNQLSFKAPLFTKLFLSAENVDSLAGAEGVETQFANRFSYLKPDTGSIDDRALFKELGKKTYLTALAAWLANYLNEFVANMKLLGRNEAAKHCDEILKSFNQKHRLDIHFGSLEDSIDDHANELKIILKQYGKEFLATNGIVGTAFSPISHLHLNLQRHLNTNVVIGSHSEVGEVLILKGPMRFIKLWLSEVIDRSQQTMVAIKARQICELVNEAGNWNTTKRIKTKNGDIHIKGLVIQLNEPMSFL